MPISKAVQIDDKVVVFDENNKEIDFYFGKLCAYDSMSVTIFYSKPVPHHSTYDEKGKRISMELERKPSSDDSMINAFMECMIANSEFSNHPNLGFFCYDVDTDDIFCIQSKLARECNFEYSDEFKGKVRTYEESLYDYWQYQCEKNKRRKKADKRFEQEFKSLPKGRIYEKENEGFLVCVGSWINDYSHVKEWVILEFNLPKDKTKFIVIEAKASRFYR